MDKNVHEIVKAAIQTQIIAAFNSGPELIEQLVKAALAAEVDPHSGSRDGYGKKVPYIDYLVADNIRNAARNAVQVVVNEQKAVIEQCVREGLNSESITQAVTKAITGAVDAGWAIKVNFEIEKDRR